MTQHKLQNIQSNVFRLQFAIYETLHKILYTSLYFLGINKMVVNNIQIAFQKDGFKFLLTLSYNFDDINRFKSLNKQTILKKFQKIFM